MIPEPYDVIMDDKAMNTQPIDTTNKLEVEKLVLEKITNIPIGLLLKYMDEEILCSALRRAINKGVELGRQMAMDAENDKLRRLNGQNYLRNE